MDAAQKDIKIEVVFVDDDKALQLIDLYFVSMHAGRGIFMIMLTKKAVIFAAILNWAVLFLNICPTNTLPSILFL